MKLGLGCLTIRQPTRSKFFLNNEPANGYHYTVGIEDVTDAKYLKFPQDLLQELIELAENDVKKRSGKNIWRI